MRPLAQLHEDVCFGRSQGRIIWQPRILAWYDDRVFNHEPLPEPYTGLSQPDLFRALGCSDRLYNYFNPCFEAVEDPAVRVEVTHPSPRETLHVIHTPVGTQTTLMRQTPDTWAPMVIKREIGSEAEMRVATWRAQRRQWRFDAQRYHRAVAEVGDLGAPTMFMPRTTLQDLLVSSMSTEEAIYAVIDWPDAVSDYFVALDDAHDRLIDVINASPVNIINFGDNLHAHVTSPDLFERYVLPSYLRRCERLHRAGKFVCSHWDGATRSLLPYARSCGLDGIEAITPRPQGDVTLDEMKQALGDEVFLLDGIPAVFFDATYSLAQLEDCVHELIEKFAPRLVLGISDEMSSTGDIHRVKRVGEIVDAYNQQHGG